MKKYPICTIAKVISPRKYCVVSNDKEHVSDVKTLEKRMRQEMRFSDIPEFHLNIQMCVAVIDRKGKFRRGVVEAEIEDDLYQVFLIDYGLTVQVEKSKLRIITDKGFMKVEPLAFFVILYGLIPTKYVRVGDIKKCRPCEEWVSEALTFVENLFECNKKVVVQSILIEDRIVFGELFVRPNPDEKYIPLRKLLCQNKFCVYSESSFIEQSGFLPFRDTRNSEYETKMEFIRKWQKESLPFQNMDPFLSPIKGSDSETSDPMPLESSSPPESVFKTDHKKEEVLRNEETLGASASNVPKYRGMGRGKLYVLISEMKKMKQISAGEGNEGSHGGDSFNKTEMKVSKGRGKLFKKYLEAKNFAKPGKSTMTSSSGEEKFGNSDVSTVSESSELEKHTKTEDSNSVSKVERAVIKEGEFSEFGGDSNEMTELSLSTDDGPPPLMGTVMMTQNNETLVLNRDSCSQDELNKTETDSKSAKSLKFANQVSISKRSETISYLDETSSTLSSVETVQRWNCKENTRKWAPYRFAALTTSWTPYTVFEDSFVEPVNTFAELPIQSRIIKNLEKRGSFSNLSQVQRWAIPAIRKQHNIAVIGSAKTGKTLSYVIPIIDYVQDATYFEELPEGNGPSVVIVASSSTVCESVYNLCHLLLGNYTDHHMIRSEVKIVMSHGSGRETEVWVSLTNGCDILISTPHCLARLLEMPVITNFGRLSCLVLDEIDVISQNPYWKSLRIILEKAKFVTKNRHFQKILSGEKLTPEVRDIMKTYLESYALVIGSYSEAVIYEGLKPNIYLVDRDKKLEMLFAKLKNKINKSKILIVCELKSAAVVIKDFLCKKGISALIVHENILADKIKEIRNVWKTLKTSILIATDEVLNELNINDVQTLIHYDLPIKSKTNFYQRYSTLNGFLQNLGSSSKCRDKKRNAEMQHIIFVDDENHYQLPHIVDFAVRLGGKISPKLLQKCDEIRRQVEVNKRDVPICRNLLSFGRCRKSKTCPRRHAFISSLDSCGSLPTSGWVSFVVLKSHDASWFSARLTEHVDAEGRSSKLEDQHLELPLKLSEVFKEKSNRRPLGTPKIGNVCAVKSEIQGQEVFFRAKIIEYLKVDKYEKPLTLNVKLIDRGDIWKRKNTELYELPEELLKCPASAVDIIVVGIQPMDFDVSWSQIANDFAEGLMTQTLQENQYWSGRIVLALNGTLFLDPIKRKEFLPHLNAHVFNLIVSAELINKRLAVANNEHLTPLLKLCGEGGIEISKKGGQKKEKDSTIVQPQWAFFDSDYIQVKFLAAESTSMIFLQPKKFERLLQDLEDECHKEGQRKAAEIKIRKRKKGSFVGQKIAVGMFCLALFEDGKWNRGRVESENDTDFYVFFVDHGDFLFVPKTDVVSISETLLLRLPCQAIECSLVGIKEEEECPLDVVKEIYSFSEDGNECLYACVVRKDLQPHITKGRRYSLNLVNSAGISVNKMLVDQKMVRIEESEKQHLKDIDMDESEANEEEWRAEADEDDEKNSEVNVSPDKFEDYMNSLPDHVFQGDDGQDFLMEFASRFFPSSPSKEKPPETKDEMQACPPTSEKASTGIAEVCNENSRRLIQLFKKRQKKNKKELQLKSRENVLTPQVLWSQNQLEIRLKILLGGVQDYSLECTDSNVSFRCLREEKLYAMDVRLFGAISPSMTKVTVKPFLVLVVLTKLAFPPWPRLHADEGKMRWIKLDVEDFQEEGEDFSDRISTAKKEIESGLLKKGRRDDDILPCSDSSDFTYSETESNSDDDN